MALGGLPPAGSAADPSAARRALVYVPEPEDIARIEALGLPVYARLEGRDGPYLLVGADPGAAAGASRPSADATSGDLDVWRRQD